MHEYKVLRNNVTSELERLKLITISPKKKKTPITIDVCGAQLTILLGKSKTRYISNEDLSPNIFNEHFATINDNRGQAQY